MSDLETLLRQVWHPVCTLDELAASPGGVGPLVVEEDREIGRRDLRDEPLGDDDHGSHHAHEQAEGGLRGQNACVQPHVTVALAEEARGGAGGAGLRG